MLPLQTDRPDRQGWELCGMRSYAVVMKWVQGEHEQLSPSRVRASVLGLVALICLLWFRFGGTLDGKPAGLGFLWAVLLLAAGACLMPSRAAPVARIWEAWWKSVGKGIALMALALVYFGVLTPLGWLRRSRGVDPLNSRIDRDAETYWIPLNTEAPPSQAFRQY